MVEGSEVIVINIQEYPNEKIQVKQKPAIKKTKVFWGKTRALEESTAHGAYRS